MMAWRRKRTEKNKNKIYSNNRINIIIAIVFLLGGAILYQLFQIQVEKQDLYTAIASNQHQIFSELDPARGKIFMSDSEGESSAEEFSTLATNKEFALVYAIPKDIKDAEMTAENLYIVFKQKQVEEEVDKLLAKLTKQKLAEELAYVASLGLAEAERLKKENEVNNRYETLKYNKDHQEYLLIKREAEIKLRHDQIIEDYLNILNKRNDPYEPLEKKVDEETLIKFYSLMLNDKTITANDLEFKNGEIINKLAISDNNNIITLAGLGYAMITYRYYPENNIGSHLLGFVSQDSDEPRGKYGLEGFFDEELFGLYGSIKSEQGAEGQALIINDRVYNPPVDGSSLVLTINRSIQFTVCKKLNETALRHGADSGTIIVMEPNSGAIIAMCSWPDFDPNNYQEVDEIKVFNNPAIFEQYEPGSVFKAITMAAALDQEKITPETTYNDEGKIMITGWPKAIKNSDYDSFGGHGEVNMTTVLELSLNTGAIYAMEQIGPDIFADYIRSFGFGEKTGIELATESSGDIENLKTEKVQEIYAATASFGQGISATPLQLITAFAAIANGGILVKPYIVKEIIYSDGRHDTIQPKQIKRVISTRAATLLSGMLVKVIESGHAIRAGVDGYFVAGKTGTAQVASGVSRGYSSKTIHNFVGFAPADEPKFVMLVKLNDPKDVTFSASSAAPLFGEIAEYLLQYYQVPKERK